MRTQSTLRRRVGTRLLCCTAIIYLTFAVAVLWITRAAEPNQKPKADVTADHAERLAKGLEIFKKDVRPVLIKRCVGCHGRDDVESDFNLTTRAGLLKGGAAGPVLVFGPQKTVAFDQAKKSRFYRLIIHAEEPYMPHDEKKLSGRDAAQIAAWIDHGAPYDKPLVDAGASTKNWTEKVVAERARDFWSFRPLHRTVPPVVRQASRCQTPIDRFIQAALEAKELELNPEADRRKLIRRACFDLIGLPPDPETVESFANDPSPDAYDRLLERLLASPHYGERWGRHWLDLARFAESHGFEHDTDRKTAYHYRDFVIQAFNDDLPYDTFVRWQLAGDELAPQNRLAMMATGFLAAGVHSTQITANEVEKHRYDELDDMLATTGTAMLGLTLGCARCHDHKYDPIPQRDYYRLLSAFTTTIRSEAEVDFDPEWYRTAKAAFDREHKPLEAGVKAFETEQLPARFDQWEKVVVTDDLPKWVLLDVVSYESAGGATFEKLDDGSLLAGGTNPNSDAYTFVAETNLQGIRIVRLEALPHPSFVKGGPGRGKNGNFVWTDFRMMVAPRNDKSAKPVEIKLKNPKATSEQNGLPAAAVIDGDKKSGWAVDPQLGKNHAASFETGTPVGFDGGTRMTFTLKFEGNAGHNIGRLRLSIAAAADALPLEGNAAPQGAIEALATPRAERTKQQRAALHQWYRTLDPQWQRLNKIVRDHLKQAPQPKLVKVLISSEGVKPLRLHTQGADFFNETFFLRRGNPNLKEGVASLGFLQVLTTAPDREQQWPARPTDNSRTSFRRAALADWITDTRHGAARLLARVIVNRLWQHHVGRGIVDTPSDFGSRGERPSHPQLLDWLATELIRQNWRLKPIHKLIMLSSVYRQTLQPNQAGEQKDPDNRLFWRRSRRRLEAEVIRDALLAVSNSLETRMFGPGTLDEANQRRSIYFTVKRSKMISMLQVFDAPEPLSGIAKRPSTTIAPQALLLINNPHVRNSARTFARRLLPAAEVSLERAVFRGYLTAIGRDPLPEELDDTLRFLGRQTESYRSGGKRNARELALTDFCQVLICLNEFVYVE